MLPAGVIRYIDFRIVDVNSAPVAGRVLDDWAVVFRRDNAACADALALTDHGEGRYTVSYLPSKAGHDYLEIYDQANDIRILDTEDIVVPEAMVGGGSSTYLLDGNYGGIGALRLAEPDPQTYTLYVYESADWERGNRDESFARGAVSLDSAGNWVSSVLVAAGTYHIVARRFRDVKVIRAYLQVSAA